jgi:putative membrane protein insertion efficiency factor
VTPAHPLENVAAVCDRRQGDLGIRTTVTDRRYHSVRFIARLPARALLALLWLYQRTLSPVLPVVLGPSCGCRFAPTCSHYAVEAIRVHGALFGTFLMLRRLVKCTPLHPGGLDPVPPRRVPRCTRAPLSPLASSL